jgi:hypothetical protein
MKWHHVAIAYDGSGKASGVRIILNGVEQTAKNVEVDSLSKTIKTSVPLRIGSRSASEPLTNARLQDIRIYKSALTSEQIASIAGATRAAFVVTQSKLKTDEPSRRELMSWWLETIDPAWRQLKARLMNLVKIEADIMGRATVAHVMSERPEPPEAYILERGEYTKRKEKVLPNTPKMLPAMPADFPKNRLGFARWLFLPEHPLTARVTVNRFWQQVFGVGIVATPGDFGVSGELPTHPELLDWLAIEFRDSGWDVKKFFKLMVMSSTYRQAAITTPLKLERDAGNRLLSRGPRFRLDAEVIRDYALTASGLLQPKVGGPSVRPYQPPGVWEAVAMPESNTRIYRMDSGEKLYRRSLYTFWKRAAPPASMEILNAPNREVCTVRRERTNTPLQALLTLNDIQFVEAARYLADRVLSAGSHSLDERLNQISQRLLARPLTEVELSVVRDSFKELLEWYRTKPDEARKLISVGESKPNPKVDAMELAAMTMVVNQMMNLDEMLNK